MTTGRTYPYDSRVRVVFGDKIVIIYAWPSRGGVIVLDEAEAIDMAFWASIRSIRLLRATTTKQLRMNSLGACCCWARNGGTAKPASPLSVEWRPELMDIAGRISMVQIRPHALDQQ